MKNVCQEKFCDLFASTLFSVRFLAAVSLQYFLTVFVSLISDVKSAVSDGSLNRLCLLFP